MGKSGILLAVFIFSITTLSAQTDITVDDFTIRDTFAEKKVTGINWMKDGKFYTALAENRILRYDITTGQTVQTLVDGALLQPNLAIHDYSFSADETKILLQTQKRSIYRRSFIAEYFVYDLNARTL